MKNKKLVILFDANPLMNGSKSGVGYYTELLITSIAKQGGDDVKLIGQYFNFLSIKDSSILPNLDNISYIENRFFPSKILTILRNIGIELPLELFFRKKGNVALYTNFVSMPSIFRIPSMIVVHDLCYIEVPEYVSSKNAKFLRKFVPRSIKRADRVITVSESTQRAVQKNYNVSSNKFLITPIPPLEAVEKDRSQLKRLKIKEKYILFVGTLEPRKNIKNLVKAYEKLEDTLQDEYSLVLAGATGWYMDSTMAYIRTLQKSGLKIYITGYVSETERAALYTNAELVVMPSHYEGFGMPILEALSYRRHVACSDIPVFHEVAGDAVSYFNQNSPQSISNEIKKVLIKNDRINKRAKVVLKRINSWETISEEILRTSKEIAEQ